MAQPDACRALGGAILAAFGLAFAASAAPPGLPALVPGTVQSVEVVILAPWTDVGPAKVVSADGGAIEALAAVIRRGEPAPDHKCKNVGTLLFRTAGGGQVQLGILPGHTAGFYEYRFYSGDSYAVFRVEREALAAALRRLGIGRIPD